MDKSRNRLTFRIVLGMASGMACGVILNLLGNDGVFRVYLSEGLFVIGGTIFVSFLKLLVVPIILVSLTCGIASLDNVRTLGRLGRYTLGFYLSTTAVAVSLALALGLLIAPGVGLELAEGQSFQNRQAPGLVSTLTSFFPSNPFKAMSDAQTLQLLVIACLLGITLPMVGGAGKRILALFSDLNEVILKMMMLIMALAPYGTFCLTAQVFAQQGIGTLLGLAKYFVCLLLALVVHVLMVYCSILKLTKLSIGTFFSKARDFALLAFSTASSGATLPVTMETMENKMGVSKSVSSFTLPLGATIHMNGSAMMQGVATAFIAQVYGVDLSFGQMSLVVVMSTLAAVGTAAVPGAALITLTMVLHQVNLPPEGIGLIIGVDRLLDMARTSVNVLGDAVVSLWVAKKEEKLDEDIYNN